MFFHQLPNTLDFCPVSPCPSVLFSTYYFLHSFLDVPWDWNVLWRRGGWLLNHQCSHPLPLWSSLSVCLCLTYPRKKKQNKKKKTTWKQTQQSVCLFRCETETNKKTVKFMKLKINKWKNNSQWTPKTSKEGREDSVSTWCGRRQGFKNKVSSKTHPSNTH